MVSPLVDVNRRAFDRIGAARLQGHRPTGLHFNVRVGLDRVITTRVALGVLRAFGLDILGLNTDLLFGLDQNIASLALDRDLLVLGIDENIVLLFTIIDLDFGWLTASVVEHDSVLLAGLNGQTRI